MASGKTLQMISFSRRMQDRVIPDREPRERNRNLNGKDRVRARVAAQREARLQHSSDPDD